MKPSALRIFFVSLLFAVAFFPSSVGAQDRNDVILPAGTLLRCTLNEPSFSSKSADVGDPVICNLAEVNLFGHPAFPRGAYLGGHLEADKDPGHFFGKGYLQLEFDHVGTPEGLLPVPAKVIAARGYKVDRQGKIIGHGHATRDAVEWMFPPLWPIKVLTLPARGPRPTLKGEEPLTLRLMDDIAIPSGQFAQVYPSRPAASSLPSPSYAFPNRYIPAARAAAPPSLPAPPPPAPGSTTARALPIAPGQSVLILRNGQSYVATNIRVDGNRLTYTKADGIAGATPLDDVDWTKTFQFNAESGVALTLSGTNSAQ